MSGYEETFDWVVVGSGAGSMASALVMREAGKSVAILEKTGLVGGTTAKSGGVIWVPANRFIKADGEHDSVEAGMTYLEAVCENLPGSTREKRAAYVTEATRMIDFLVEQGIELERCSKFWPDYYDELPGGCTTSRTVVAKPFDKKQLGEWEDRLRPGFLPMKIRLDDGLKLPFAAKSWKIKALFAKVALGMVAAKLRGQRWVTAGAALQGRMLQASLKAGVDIRTDAPVTELVLEDGAVTGVMTTRNGQPWRIGARLGVLVNAGGFGKNQAMRDRYMPGTRAEWSQVPEGDTGDLHGEIERIGGVLGQMDQMVGYQMTRAPGWEQAYVMPPAQGTTGKPHAILVDQSGVRYINEGGSYELYCQTMRERDATVPAVPSWAIFDANYAADYGVGGVKLGRKTTGWAGAGYLKQADTIPELAAQIGVYPAVLTATVERSAISDHRGVRVDYELVSRTDC